MNVLNHGGPAPTRSPEEPVLSRIVRGPRCTPRRLPLAVTTALLALVAASPAQAGRLVVTGHDADHHCMRDAAENRPESCHFAAAAITWVRAAAPDAGKPVLILDRG